MKNSINTPITWSCFVSVSSKGFPKRYQSLFKKYGILKIGNSTDFYAKFNLSDEKIKEINEKIKSYKHYVALLSFKITDKQFGLIGTNKFNPSAKVPTSLGYIPVTYKQMYDYGCICIKGSQRHI